ncbi:hypothetical protein Vretimale_800 [Volvox reticuliferus]|uniref:Uncharacterized protein n=1 Tax=Volvox reticuliferus TaxID=1737510 RepID=A0A8J4D7S3_9CHLO|nr:hypothetical protein Vretimale_800 [Volvox reticuliferus]
MAHMNQNLNMNSLGGYQMLLQSAGIPAPVGIMQGQFLPGPSIASQFMQVSAQPPSQQQATEITAVAKLPVSSQDDYDDEGLVEDAADSDGDDGEAADEERLGSSSSKPSKVTKKKKMDSPWSGVHCSVLLRQAVLIALAAAVKSKGAALAPDETDNVFDSSRTELLTKLSTDKTAAKATKKEAEAKRLQQHIDSIIKLHDIKSQRKSASWNNLVWTWIHNASVHGKGKVRSSGKFSVAAIQDDDQRTQISEAIDTIRRFSDLGHGLAGIDTIKPAQLQQQALREAAHRKRKAVEQSREENQKKQSQVLEKVLEIVKDKADTQSELVAQIARSNDLKERDINLKSQLQEMMKQLVESLAAASKRS